MKLRKFLSSLFILPLISGCIPKNFGMKSIPPKKRNIVKGDIVRWNEWAAYPHCKNWAQVSLVTQVWNDGMVLINDRRGVHERELTVIGHDDTITASQGTIINK